MTTSSATRAPFVQPPYTPTAKIGHLSIHSTPVKSILKTASVLGVRKTRHDEGDDDNEKDMMQVLSESPTKKRRVLFDDIRNVTYELTGRTIDDVKLEVKNALEEHLRGNDGQYDALKEMFDSDRQRKQQGDEEVIQPQELQNYMFALTSYVSMLRNKECRGLVKAILRCSWLGRDEAFFKAYTHFLVALVSSQGSYLHMVLATMVDKFTQSRLDDWTVPDYPQIDRETMRARLHYTIRHLLQMIPSAKSVLESLLKSSFPFPDMSMRLHMAYIHNLLRVKDYAPDLQEEILDLILDRVVKMDSQMQVDLEDMDDDLAAAVMYNLREKNHGASSWEDDEEDNDDSDEDSDVESVDNDDPDFDQDGARIKTVKGSVEKMDAVLDTLFTYYTPLFANPSSDLAFDAFTTILREFEQMVLPTYKSRHTQFLVFHFAQLDHRLVDAFCGQLIAMAFQTNIPNILKQAAAAYLASFVARAANVSGETVRDIFRLLIHHLGEYRQRYEPICRGPDLKRFHPYYSLVQAVLYIFCFRWQDLVVSSPELVDPEDPASYIGQDLEWVGSSKRDLSTHIFGKLNPLKICAPVIVEEFAKLAHRLNFLYVYPLIENNKRIRLTQFLTSTYSNGGALRDAGFEAQDEAYHQLDPYFPFDPYQLPVSKRWLEGDYVHWKGVPGLNEDESEDDSDSDNDLEDEGEDGIEEQTATDSEGEDEY